MANNINDLLIRIDVTTEQLRREVKRAETATEQAAAGIDKSMAKVDRSFARGVATQQRFGGAIQQAGYQVGDLAVQLASGQSALVAFTQQGSQLAGAFGPGGAIFGAVLAIGGAIAGYFVRSMEDGKKATDALADSLRRLDEVVDEQDGIRRITEDLRDLARESETAARARIVSAVSAAEEAVRSSARGIREAFDDITDTVGFSDLSDFFFTPQTMNGMKAVRQAIDDLRDSLGLTGDEGTESARKIFEALKLLNADPTIENLKAVEEVVAQTSTTIGASSKELQNLVAVLSEFFDGARSAADQAAFLQRTLAGLDAGRKLTFEIEEIDKKSLPKARKETKKKAVKPERDLVAEEMLRTQAEVERFFQSTRTEVEQIEAQIARVQQLAAEGFFKHAGIDDQDILRRLNEQLQSVQAKTEETSTVIRDIIESNLGGAIDEMFASGEISAKNFANSVLRDLLRIATQIYIMKPLIESLFGSGGGEGKFGKAVFSAFGFAKGGSFRVGGSGGPDSQFVPLKLSPGEHVRITPPGRSASDTIVQVIDQRGAGSPPVDVQEQMNGLQKMIRVTVRGEIAGMYGDGSIDKLNRASGMPITRRGNR